MPALSWDAMEDRTYEGGIDRGVLYISGIGVAWNGLRSVDVNVGNSSTPVHLDGVKVRDIVAVGDFTATLKAFTYPEEFLACDGVHDVDGVYISSQFPEPFGLSYRTRVGSAIDGDLGYKLHLFYNLTAIPDTRTYSTFSDSPTFTEFGWTLTGIPMAVPGHRPSVHFSLDSRTISPKSFKVLEDLLYGTKSSAPTLIPMEAIIVFIENPNALVIVDHGDGTWTAIDPRNRYVNPFMVEPDTFELNSPTVVMVGADTYDVSSYTP